MHVGVIDRRRASGFTDSFVGVSTEAVGFLGSRASLGVRGKSYWKINILLPQDLGRKKIKNSTDHSISMFHLKFLAP